MKRNRLALALPLLAASAAHADTRLWLDAYGGGHVDETAGLSVHEDNLFTPDQAASARFDPETRPLTGLRLRLEADPLPVAFVADLGFRRTHVPQADLDLLPVTLGLALPSTLTLARFDGGGSLHPRGLLGITATGVDGSVRLGNIRGEVTDNTWGPRNGRAGLAASLGLEWRPTPAFALFTEYRYENLRFHLEHTDDETLPTRSLETTGRIESQAVLVGVSFRLLQQEPARAGTPASTRESSAATDDGAGTPADGDAGAR